MPAAGRRGGNGEPNLRDAEKLKIACAAKHFEALALDNFTYDVKSTYRTARIG